MTINKNPIISFNEIERNSVSKVYMWLYNMTEDDFYTLGDEVAKAYPNFEIDHLFDLLDDLVDFMDDSAK